MAYLKFSAEKIFDGYRFLAPGSVLVTEEDGTVSDIINASDAGDGVQLFPGVLSPGFVNCHCHLELSHMKGVIPTATGLIPFIAAVMKTRHANDGEIFAAIEKAEDEMLNNGVVAVGDICNSAITLAQKNKGRMYYHNFIEVSGFNPAVAASRFERSVQFFREFGSKYAIPVESNSIVPHAPYSVADELWEMILHFPGNHLLTIHNQETIEEQHWFMEKTGGFVSFYEQFQIDTSFFTAPGKSSLQSYLSKFLRNQSVIFVHNVHSSEEDILFSKANAKGKHYWCLCPNANQYISGRLPDIDLLLKHGCEIVLGTDSLASNHALNILSEINTVRKDFPHISLETTLRWATSNGAKALQLDQVIGSFEKGKRPGIVSVDEQTGQSQRIL